MQNYPNYAFFNTGIDRPIIENIFQYVSENVELEFNKTYDKQTIETETKNIWQQYNRSDYKKSPFHFEKSKDDAFYFNLKYYKLFKGSDAISYQEIKGKPYGIDRYAGCLLGIR